MRTMHRKHEVVTPLAGCQDGIPQADQLLVGTIGVTDVTLDHHHVAAGGRLDCTDRSRSRVRLTEVRMTRLGPDRLVPLLRGPVLEVEAGAGSASGLALAEVGLDSIMGSHVAVA